MRNAALCMLPDTPDKDTNTSMIFTKTCASLLERGAPPTGANVGWDRVCLFSAVPLRFNKIYVKDSNMQGIMIPKGYSCRTDENAVLQRPRNVVSGVFRGVWSMCDSKCFTEDPCGDCLLCNCICEEVELTSAMRKTFAANAKISWPCSDCRNNDLFPVGWFAYEVPFLYRFNDQT